LQQELRMVGHYKRVLVIGAHPDDEDTDLLTVLVRQMGAEAAYLSLNRGEGGQNLIGPELGEELGVIRTEELLAARRLDGAQQFFTRAYDFGFSKTLAETWQHWPQDSILKDVVRIVRRFRPQIIVAIFSGTPIDGHGQHQAAGWAAKEAFEVAGDSARFPELLTEEALRPWRVSKLYRSARFDTAATTLTMDGGALDEVVGQSYHQIAMRGRSLHRSQDMGRLQTMGPASIRVALLEDRTGTGGGGLFTGIDTTVAALPWGGDGPPGDVFRKASGAAAVITLLDSAEAKLGLNLPRGQARVALDRALASLEAYVDNTVTIERTQQLEHIRNARKILRGVLYDAFADADRVAPGQLVRVNYSLWNTGTAPISVTPDFEPGPTVAGPERSLAAGPGALDTGSVVWRVPEGSPPSQPYYLTRPRSGDLYTWPTSMRAYWGVPFEPSVARVRFLEGNRLEEDVEVTRRTNDQAQGEIRRPVFIVPRVAVTLEPEMLVWPTSSVTPRTFTVTLTHGAKDTTEGTLRLDLPPGWPPVAPVAFVFTRPGEERTVTFSVRPPPGLRAGTLRVRALATDSRGRADSLGVEVIDYPHIRPHQLVKPAESSIRATPLVLPRLSKVGYVRGAADRVPEALQEVGLPIVILDKATLERGNLAQYEAIVIGSRAYETDTALVLHNDRLLAYARAGGLVIVQYQQFQFSDEGYAPYPLTIGVQRGLFRSHDRVTDENAKVTVLNATSGVLNAPNRIGKDDWEGWVQERGLYFAHTWDQRYRPLLEMHDPGEDPLRGSLLVARVGKGTWVYTGLSFFRQLPAGVPGAFRLFANLLALGRTAGG
jgi:LmbE family N-acetylglucosaminyl deacetylase